MYGACCACYSCIHHVPAGPALDRADERQHVLLALPHFESVHTSYHLVLDLRMVQVSPPSHSTAHSEDTHGPARSRCAGSTGISLAMVAAAAGCRCAVALPDDAAAEKGALLEALGARVLRQRPVSIAHPQHFVNVARRLAAEAAAHSPANPEPGGPANPGTGSPAELGASGLEPCRAADAGGTARPAQTMANGTAVLEQSGGGSASAGTEGSSNSRSERMSLPDQAAGPGAAAVSQDGAGPAGAASSGSACSGAGKNHAGGGDGSGGSGGGGGSGGCGGGAVFADQFENLANYRAHLATGAEIWAQVLRCINFLESLRGLMQN